MYKSLIAFLDLLIKQPFFINFFFTYIRISKDSSAKYYQDNKKRPSTSFVKESLSKEEKEKMQQYGRER